MTYRPSQLLSRNSKCGKSLDLPLKGHCRPTKNCSHDCYARTGRQSFPKAKRKHRYVSRLLARHDLEDLTWECRGCPHVRLCGSGDLNIEHVRPIINLAEACPQTEFWGMTRKPEIAKAVNGHAPNLRLLLSVDSSSPKSVWQYQGAMCWGPRRPTDQVPDDPRIKVIFPRHFAGRVVNGMPRDPRDCLSVWHDLDGCSSCGRCWSWSPEGLS
jgi:hypothetical protein